MTATFGFVLLTVEPSSPVVAATLDAATREAVETREAFGLPIDAATMASLAARPEEASLRWGFPLTNQEEGELDIPARSAFVGELEPDVLPYLRSLETFGGIWINQAGGGGAVVQLTANIAGTKAEVDRRLPNPSRPISYQLAAHTQEQLRSASEQAWNVWAEEMPDLRPVSIAVTVSQNELAFTFEPSDVADADKSLASVNRKLGVPGFLRAEASGSDTACNGRNDCHTPFESGILIYRDFSGSSWYCTMGFHITVGTNEQFFSAGHCGHFTPNDWHHPTFPGTFVGNEIATLYASGGKDIMRVDLLDSQASQFVFAEPNTLLVETYTQPVDGEAVCASRGKSSSPIIGCGVVQDSWDSWWSDTVTPNWLMWGADSSIPAINGDSGSPLYRKVQTAFGDYLSAQSVLVHEGGFFARVSDGFAAWGGNVYNP